MIQVIEGQIVQYKLPKVGVLLDGRTVSGYNMLSEETLKKEGWLPLEDMKPNYDIETQYLISNGYEILEDKVIKKYRIEHIIVDETPQEPTEVEMLKAQNKALVDRQEFIEDIIAEMAMMIYD